jgi:hypothetical protein
MLALAVKAAFMKTPRGISVCALAAPVEVVRER